MVKQDPWSKSQYRRMKGPFQHDVPWYPRFPARRYGSNNQRRDHGLMGQIPGRD